MGRIIREKVVCCDTGKMAWVSSLEGVETRLNVLAWVDDQEIDHPFVITQRKIAFVRKGKWLGSRNQGVKIH